MSRFSSSASALFVAVLLSGCNLAPKYERPTGAIPQALPQGGIYPAAASDAPDITAMGWREFFTDPRLQSVIEAGLANNRDLRLAATNVLRARAQYRVQRADLLPTISGTGTGTYTNNIMGAMAGAGGGAGGAVGGTSSDLEFYSANVGISAFELDLFGRLRNLSRAAQEQYFSSEEAQRASRISIIAEIASAWLTMAADTEQLRISRDTLASLEETRRLTQEQFRIGVASELEARQADTNYQAARNDIAARETQVARDKNALDLLVGGGVAVEHLPGELGSTRYAREGLPGDLSSAILLARPDVLQAEHLLIAENANIGAARAAFFPRISLTASVGSISTALSGLFKDGSYTYSASPSVGIPLFNFGRNSANLAASKAQQQGAVASYEKAIQTAFREVSDALATRGTIEEQVAAQTARTESALVAQKISDARYRAGVDSFLGALDAQRTAYSAQQQLVTTRLARETNLIELYRALGGGLK